jgi:hypothetical protein
MTRLAGRNAFIIAVGWLSTAAAGCDGRTLIGRNGAGGAEGLTGPAADGGSNGCDARALPDAAALITCPVAGVAVTPMTVADMRAALSRCWIQCSPAGLTGPPGIGIEITAADRYAELSRDQSGALTALQGADYQGSLSYEAIGHVQATFTSDTNGSFVTTAPVVTTNPTMLIMNNEGVVEYRYVAADEL